MSKVFIGVGHGGKDPGAVANGLREKDINLVMALEMAKILTRHGVEVALSRTAIGVGHGGKDPGAVANGLREKDINLVMALEMAKILTRHGVEVALSRTADENDPLQEELREAKAFAPDLAVEIHNNAGGGDGFEVYVQTGAYKEQSPGGTSGSQSLCPGFGGGDPQQRRGRGWV